jgi:hypothetical protein
MPTSISFSAAFGKAKPGAEFLFNTMNNYTAGN